MKLLQFMSGPLEGMVKPVLMIRGKVLPKYVVYIDRYEWAWLESKISPLCGNTCFRLESPLVYQSPLLPDNWENIQLPYGYSGKTYHCYRWFAEYDGYVRVFDAEDHNESLFGLLKSMEEE